MLLTVSIVNLLSHVAPVFTGQNVSMYLKPTEMVHFLIGESSTSIFQQQQFNMLLRGGGGEGSGISSPIVSHGSGGASREDQLPRGSKQSMSDSTEQSSVPHLPKAPSKRIRSSFDEENEPSIGASNSFKKTRLSNNSGQRSSKGQEKTSLHIGKLNTIQNSSSESSAFQGTYGEGEVTSKQTSREVQETPSFDDILTQAIQAVSAQDSSLDKETLKTQAQTQPSRLIPVTKEITTRGGDLATEPTAQPASSVTTELMEIETVSDLATEPTAQPAPSVTTESMEMETETVSDLTSESIHQPAPSVTTVLTEIETVIPSSTESTTQASHSSSVDPALQQQRRSLFDELNRQANRRQANSQKKQKSEDVKSAHSVSVDSERQERQQKMGNIAEELKRFQFNKARSSKADSIPSSSASADSAGEFSSTTRKDNSLKRATSTDKKPTFEDVLKEAIFKGLSGLKPIPPREVQVQEKAPSIPKPQEPVGMKRFALGKKSPLAKAQEETLSDRVHKLELDQKKMEQNIEWQKKHNPKFNASFSGRQLQAIKGQISQLRIQMGRERKEINPIARGVASPHPMIPIAQNLLPEIKGSSTGQGIASSSSSSSIATSQDDLLAGVKGSSIAQSYTSSLSLSLPSSSISTNQDDSLPEIKGSSTDQSFASPSTLISTSQDDLLAGVKSGVNLRKTSGPVTQELPKTDLEKHRDSKLAAIRKAADADDDSGDESEDEDWGPKTTPSFVTPVRQPVLVKIKPSSPKASSVDTPPVSTPVKTSPKTMSADSPARRAVLEKLRNASPQAASAPSLLEQLRAAKKQKKAQQAQQDVPSTSAVVVSLASREVSGETDSVETSSGEAAVSSTTKIPSSTDAADSHGPLSVLSRSFNNLLSSVQRRFGEDVSEPKDESQDGPQGSKQKLPLGSSDGWGAEDDEWDED